jgi:hypothetical protein
VIRKTTRVTWCRMGIQCSGLVARDLSGETLECLSEILVARVFRESLLKLLTRFPQKTEALIDAGDEGEGRGVVTGEQRVPQCVPAPRGFGGDCRELLPASVWPEGTSVRTVHEYRVPGLRSPVGTRTFPKRVVLSKIVRPF